MTSNAWAPFASAIYSLMAESVDSWTGTSTVLASLTIVTLLTYLWITRYWPTSFDRLRDESCSLPLPPGSIGYPLVGESLEFTRKGSDFYATRLKRFGKVYKSYLFGRPVVRVVGAENVRPVLMGEYTTVKFTSTSVVLQILGPHALANLEGDDHRRIKTILSSLFTPNALTAYVPRLQMVIDRHLDRWCQMSEEQGEFLGFPACQNMIKDLTLETVLGADLEQPQSETLGTALNNVVNNMFSWPVRIPGCGLWKGLKARERILEQIHKKLNDGKPRSDTDFLSIVELMQHHHEMGKELKHMEDSSVEMMFAGFSTVSSAFSSALLCLGKNPEALRKVEKELDEHGLLDDPSKELTYDVIGQLDYVNSFNKEVLRVYPPVGAGFRTTAKTMQIGGYQIPKGWTLVYSIRETQQTSEVFSDRDSFKPERWLNMDQAEWKEKLRYHYIPFGLGPRMCAGRRLAIVYQAVFLVEVVRRCRFFLKNPDSPVEFIPVPRPRDNLTVTFRRRLDDAGRSDSCRPN